MKIGIVGSGSVGATIAYSIASTGLASRIVLVDMIASKAEGEVLDLGHCAAFIPPVRLSHGDIDACKGMDVVVVTAGVKRRSGEQRTDLIQRNLSVCKDIASPLAAANPDAIFILVSNPVDLLTLYWLKHSGVPSGRIIGSGTLLDSSRFRYLLSQYFSIDPRNVHAYIIGEHGVGSVPVWSHAAIGTVSVDDFASQVGLDFSDTRKQKIFEEVLSAGKHVIERKGATFYGIAQSVLRILTVISRDEGSLLTVSTEIDGFGGERDVALSVPVVVGRGGIRQVVKPQLNDDELSAFTTAAKHLKALAEEVGLLS